MPDKLEIEVFIGADGTVKLITHGLKGAICIAETEALEKAVGKVIRREKTAEYYDKAAAAKTSTKGS
jgi:hypothetical protein